jgi:aspartyl-tRNA(Asn)/glutamyl-tRNA(Gln) amidotransferase subunit A
LPFHASLALNQAELNKGNITCVTLVQYYLDNIKKNSDLNAFIEVFSDEALARAKEIDLKINSGTQGSLAGLVVGIKDLISFEGHKVAASSKILDGYEAIYSSTALERLLDEDAIIIGRQNCDEFGMGSANENSAFGPVYNGADNTKVPGGSSGGSAVAVQMNMCTVSLGTDTGGSVRQPAAFCGVIGLKPTYSRISRNGLIAYASSFDTIGIISNNLADNKRVLEVIAGSDEKDSTSSSRPIQNKEKKRKRRFCYYKELLASGLGDKETSLFNNKILQLRERGYSVDAVSFPLQQYLVPAYYLLTMAEASSNLSRYDGVRYGLNTEKGDSFIDLFANNRSEGFGAEVKRRILLGTFVLSSGYYDAYVTKAQKVRRLIKDHTAKIFAEYDFLLSPTTPTVAFDIGKKRTNPTEVYLEDVFTVEASLAGIPAISIPFNEKINNLPYGLQIAANEFEELALYEVAEEILALE